MKYVPEAPLLYEGESKNKYLPELVMIFSHFRILRSQRFVILIFLSLIIVSKL